MKNCPYCWEKIQKVAKKCRYCWEWLENTKELENNENKIEKTEKEVNKNEKKSIIKNNIETYWKDVMRITFNRFVGRFSRNEFVRYFSIIWISLWFLYLILFFFVDNLNWIWLRIYWSIFFLNLFLIPARVKRLHDIWLTWWFSLFFLIVPFRWFFDLLLAFRPWNKEDNKYWKKNQLNWSDDTSSKRWMTFIIVLFVVCCLFKDIFFYPFWYKFWNLVEEVKDFKTTTNCLNQIKDKKNLIDEYISCTDNLWIKWDISELDVDAVSQWFKWCIKDFTIDYWKVYWFDETCPHIEILKELDDIPWEFLTCQLKWYNWDDTDEKLEKYIWNSVDCYLNLKKKYLDLEMKIEKWNIFNINNFHFKGLVPSFYTTYETPFIDSTKNNDNNLKDKDKQQERANFLKDTLNKSTDNEEE